MSRRDSDSKRHHSRFDREPSPKRYRRDGKQEREREGERERERERDRDRERERVTTNGGGGQVDRDQRNHLPHHSKQVNRDAAAADKKSNDHNEAASKHSSDPTQPPRSHSYYQHDERGSAGQVGRSGRREAGAKVLTQSREHDERVNTSQNKELRDEKSHSKLDDNFQRRDGFPERKDDQPPTTRRRPAFRETKIPVDSGEVNPATTVAVKSSQTDHHSERNERKEEKSSNPNQLDRPEKQAAYDRLPNRNAARKDGFSPRVRYGGSGGNGYYRGRDKFHGRQGYQPSKTRAEKWKHDLYQEVKDPIPKSEDDQIAKLESLLAS